MGEKRAWPFVLAAAALAGALGASAGAEPKDHAQFVPIPIYRTSPYAAGGTGIFGGFMDYMTLLNARDGGINGVKLIWEECETGYEIDRGVECYERLKSKGPTGAAMFHSVSTAITYALIERGTRDRIPIVSVGYGRADASDGRVFPYVFPLVANYWSQNTAKIKFIGQRVGGMDKLKGLKIANVYHDSPYGRETLPILERQAEIYGFEVKHYSVAHPGLAQKATWDELRKDNPDWVILRGWGLMNPTALKEAARVRFPPDRIVGVWWSGSEEDVIPAGKASVGYIAAGFHPAGRDFPLIQDILEHVHGKGKGNIEASRIGTVYYNRGVIHGILTTEAIRTAMHKYGNQPLTGEQVRWGLENLNITDERLTQLGAEGLMSPIKTSCMDHEGGGMVLFQQWDGHRWNVINDWIAPDKALVRAMIETSAAAYAKEKGIAPRTSPE